MLAVGLALDTRARRERELLTGALLGLARWARLMVKSVELVARLARVAQGLVGAALRLELAVQAKASEVRLGGCQGRRRGRGLERRVSARSGRVRRLGQRGRRRRRRRESASCAAAVAGRAAGARAR